MTPTPPPAPAEEARAAVAKALSRFHCDITYTMESACSDILTALRPPAHGEHQGKPQWKRELAAVIIANYVTTRKDSHLPDVLDQIERECLQPAQGNREATGTPRTDEQANISSDPEAEYVLSDFARTLERELSAAHRLLDAANNRFDKMMDETRTQFSAQSARLAEVERSREELLVRLSSLKASTDYAISEKDKHGRYWHDLAQEHIVAHSRMVIERDNWRDTAKRLDSAQSRALAAEQKVKEVQEELSMVLSDWNAIVKASGASTNGTAAAHVASLRAQLQQAQEERDAAKQRSAEWCALHSDVVAKHEAFQTAAINEKTTSDAGLSRLTAILAALPEVEKALESAYNLAKTEYGFDERGDYMREWASALTTLRALTTPATAGKEERT
jgi:hypothetical protein